MNAVSKPGSVRQDRSAHIGGKASPYASVAASSGGGDWSITEGDLQLLIAACIAAGDAVMISCSRKGYAICLTIYHDGEPTKIWCTTAEDFENAVSKVTRLALQQVPTEVAAKLTT